MASMEEVIERLARLEEKTDAQKKNLEELKQSVEELDKKVDSMDRKVFILWIIATGGLGVVFSLIAYKLKAILGGQV